MNEDGTQEVENLQTAMIEQENPLAGSELERLFSAHDQRVYQVAYHITGSAQDAEDVLQTVFLRLLRSGNLPRAEEASAYFYRAAINASVDLLRKRKHLRLVSLSDSETEPGDHRADPEQEKFSRETRDQLRKAVAKLGDTAAQIFVLRYFEGLSNVRIAQLMDTTAASIGVTLHRARKQVQQQMKHVLGGRS